MRVLLCLTLLAALSLAGCARGKAVSTSRGTPVRGARTANQEKLIITPETGLSGKVAKVNLGGRFVVLNFPVGHLPALDQRLNVYRLGLKVGEVQVTGPQLDDNVVADLVSGDVLVGDEVRDR